MSEPIQIQEVSKTPKTLTIPKTLTLR